MTYFFSYAMSIQNNREMDQKLHPPLLKKDNLRITNNCKCDTGFEKVKDDNLEVGKKSQNWQFPNVDIKHKSAGCLFLSSVRTTRYK